MLSFHVILHICFALVCILWLAERCKVSLVDAMPVFLCGLVLVLYGLAMVHRLSWIDGIAGIVTGLFAVWIISRNKEERKEFGRTCLDNMTQPSFITAVVLTAVVVLCVSGKVVTWWDDINFWATDVKSLYYLDGFAGKYGNVASEFGDYPPGAQLIKWWFLHFSPQVFREGLAFAGYYVMNMVFMFPLLRNLKGRNVPVMVLAAAALWFFPSIAEVYGYDGFCADLTMACIYGGFLLAVTDREEKTEVFYYGRLALYLGVLVLVKSIGFVWALFGLIFLILYQRSTVGCRVTEGKPITKTVKRRGQESLKAETRGDQTGNGKGGSVPWRKLFPVAVLPVLTGGSWMLFCLFMRRITKTTATAVKYVTTDEYGFSGYAGEFAAAFLRAFAGSPLHKEKSIVIDLTPFSLYLCICLLVLLFCGIGGRWGSSGPRGEFRGRAGEVLGRLYILPEKTGRIVLWFSMVSGAVFYGIIFLAHITIFATETQYLEAPGMISSIERYGAPFTVGTLLFLAGIWLNYGERVFIQDRMPGFFRKYGTYFCFFLFVALTAGYRIGYHGLVGYRGEVDARLQERAGMIGEDEARFLETIGMLGTDSSARVCYIRRGDAPRWVNNSYVGFEASPVSVVYQSVNLDDAPTDWMVGEIRSTHAGYLYAEKTDADAGAVFDEITESGEFSCEMLYRIEDTGTEMKLIRVQ